jgi:hypothetical protein
MRQQQEQEEQQQWLVYEKLQKARIKLQHTELKKSGHNKFAGYKYFELGDFLPAIQSIFFELKLCPVVSFGTELATLRIVDTENGGCVTFTSPMAEAQLKGCHPIQNLGAVETYSRRYLYVTALEIVEHDAIDSSEPTEARPAKPKSAKSVAADVFDALPLEEQEILRNAAMPALSMLAKDDLAGAVDWIVELGLDADDKVAFWSLFTSKQRSSITEFISK